MCRNVEELLQRILTYKEKTHSSAQTSTNLGWILILGHTHLPCYNQSSRPFKPHLLPYPTLVLEVATPARAAATAEATPEKTPGRPWRLCTPHVSCRRSFSRSGWRGKKYGRIMICWSSLFNFHIPVKAAAGHVWSLTLPDIVGILTVQKKSEYIQEILRAISVQTL